MAPGRPFTGKRAADVSSANDCEVHRTYPLPFRIAIPRKPFYTELRSFSDLSTADTR